ncbi:MAG: hypothetical protein RLZZ522_1682 [Verrucomicrobiota bacterium]
MDLHSDPHNHAPPVAQGDAWADAHGTVADLAPARPARRVKRAIPSPAVVLPSSRTGPDMGIHIDVTLPRRRLAADEPPAAVIKLESPTAETPFLAKQTIAAAPQVGAESQRNLQGEGAEWGRQSFLATRWMAFSAVGVVVLIVLALLTQEVWLRDSKAASTAPIVMTQDAAPGEVAGFELDGSSERDARELLATYARATAVGEVLPLIRNGAALADRLKLDWQPWRAPEHWQEPFQAAWAVSDDGGRSHGLLRGIKPDFSKFRVYFVRDGEALMIDWEATQALGDASFETLQKGKGTGGRVRAVAKMDHFFTQDFPEDSFHSFRLQALDEELFVWGYSRIGSPADVGLMRVFEAGVISGEATAEVPITVRLEPGPDDCQKNQWLIGEMLHIDWVSP